MEIDPDSPGVMAAMLLRTGSWQSREKSPPSAFTLVRFAFQSPLLRLDQLFAYLFFFFFFFNFLLHVHWRAFAYMYVCVSLSDHLEFQLQTAMKGQVVDGNQTLALCKPLNYPLQPPFSIYFSLFLIYLSIYLLMFF